MASLFKIKLHCNNSSLFPVKQQTFSITVTNSLVSEFVVKSIGKPQAAASI